MYKSITDYIKTLFPGKDFIPLHAPVFQGNEKKYLNDCIDTTYVSYVGAYVTRFEEMMCQYTGAKHAVAIVNGTCALQVALQVAGVRPGDEVITQAASFVASANAIVFAQGTPVFIDSDKLTLGMSAEKLEEFLAKNCRLDDNGNCINITTGKCIKACVPMHVFGHPVHIDKILSICQKYNIVVVEDAAESLGSFFNNQHTGTFGLLGILSFNGNKIVTTGGGGMILTNNEALAKRAKHITTTAKIPHPWEFTHDESGYNFRLTNVNAAIGCAQMERIHEFVENKRELALLYRNFFANINLSFYTEPENCQSNYWLNLLFLKDRAERDEFLKFANDNGVMSRPLWTLMNKLPMFQHCQTTNLDNAQWIEDRGVNIPSGVRL
jgi:aminotransferase in exopolysaccharide biosynthesis